MIELGFLMLKGKLQVAKSRVSKLKPFDFKVYSLILKSILRKNNKHLFIHINFLVQ